MEEKDKTPSVLSFCRIILTTKNNNYMNNDFFRINLPYSIKKMRMMNE